MTRLTPEAAIARIDDWRGKHVECEEIGGGISNHKYVITVDGGRCGRAGTCLRIPGAGTDAFIDRERELGNHRSTAAAASRRRCCTCSSPRSARSCRSSRRGDASRHPRRSPRRLEKVVEHHQDVPRHGRLRQRHASVFPMIRRLPADGRRSERLVPARLAADHGHRHRDRAGDGARHRRARSPATTTCCPRTSSSTTRPDVAHRLGVRRHERPVLRPRRLLRGAPALARRGTSHRHQVLRRDARAPVRIACSCTRSSPTCGGASGRFQERVSKLDFDYREYGNARLDRLRGNAADPEYPRGSRRCRRAPAGAPEQGVSAVRGGRHADREMRMNDEVTQPAGEVGDEVGVGTPDADLAKVFEDEALRVVEAATCAGVPLRIIGALAFHHHCPEFGFIQAKLNRVYTDIDFAGYGKQTRQIRELFVSLGYDEDLEVNAFHAEGGRLIFNHSGKPHPRRRVRGPARLLPRDPVEGKARGRLAHHPAGRAAAREDADREDQREGHHRHDHASCASTRSRPTTRTTSTAARVAKLLRRRSGVCGAR